MEKPPVIILPVNKRRNRTVFYVLVAAFIAVALLFYVVPP